MSKFSYPYVIKDDTKTIIKSFKTYADASAFLMMRGYPFRWTIQERQL